MEKRGLREELPKRIFVVSLAVVSLGAAFVYGALAHRKRLPPIPQLITAYETLFVDGFRPRYYHLQPSRGRGAGVTINETPSDGALVLIVGFFAEENQIRLMRRDGTLVRKWSPNYLEHFPDGEARLCKILSPLRTDIHGVHVTPQGEVVFNYEYCGSAKLDPCGELIWKVDRATHHSLVPAEAGGYWTLGRLYWAAAEEPNRLPPFSSSARKGQILKEDTLLRISEDGEILEEVSIPGLMLGQDVEALLTAIGNTFDSDDIDRTEVMHANKVAELPSDFAHAYPLFAAGDLVVSLRDRNLIMVLDPETKRVKWHQTGPWLRQHDPEFRPDGRISVFNNNVYRTAYLNERVVLGTPHQTNIIAVDPVSRETEVLFGEKPGQEMLSVIRGQHEVLDDGGMLITEFDAGRVFEVTRDGKIVWEYVNRYDDEFVGEITNGNIYPANYFTVEWEECES
ncbi:MAG: arylsulfotransferase family protein [Myxococcota bacterium]